MHRESREMREIRQLDRQRRPQPPQRLSGPERKQYQEHHFGPERRNAGQVRARARKRGRSRDKKGCAILLVALGGGGLSALYGAYELAMALVA